MINDFPCKICGHLKNRHNDLTKVIDGPDCRDCLAASFSPSEMLIHDFQADNLEYIKKKYDQQI